MAKKIYRDLNAVFLLDKADGASSNQVLQKVRHCFEAKKAGHTGALDPIATGMLPICFGEATKFSQFLLDSDKEYEVTALLGQRTTTSDREGEVVETRDVQVTNEQIFTAIESFLGEQQQTPSVYSALKYQGKPLYWYARQGIDVPRPTRTITFYEIEVQAIELPKLKLRVRCSKGTYIRTLVDDLGEVLGCGAHVTELRRTQVANYPYAKMMSFEALETIAEQGLDAIDGLLLPVDSALQDLPTLELTEEQAARLKQGQRFYAPEGTEPSLYRAYQSEQFVGLVEVNEKGLIQPKRLVKTN
nr:tRNA pseudouridine(55) synthase TruB [Marinifaba aquimaris]